MLPRTLEAEFKEFLDRDGYVRDQTRSAVWPVLYSFQMLRRGGGSIPDLESGTRQTPRCVLQAHPIASDTWFSIAWRWACTSCNVQRSGGDLPRSLPPTLQTGDPT